MASSGRPGQRLPSLEFLRAGCALVVMLNHVWGEGVGLPQYTPVVAVASYAVDAVIGFFVLSGCVISLQDYADTGRYVQSRLVRVLPIYYVALAMAVAGMWLCGSGYRPSQLWANALFLQTQDWLPLDPLRFFIPSWSLSYELYYYAAFIAIMAMPRLLLPLIVAAIAVGLALYFTPRPPPPATWLLHVFSFFAMWLAGVLVTRLVRGGHAVSIGTGAVMFVAGLCLARVPMSNPAKFDYFRLLGFGTGFTFLVWALLSAEILPPGAARKSSLEFGIVVRSIVAAAVLVLLWLHSESAPSTKAVLTAVLLAVAILPEATARLAARAARPAMPFMLYVAGLSYALYLVHYPLVQTSNALALLPPFASLAVVVALSFASAHLLEYRFQPWLRGRLIRKTPAPATASNSSMRR